MAVSIISGDSSDLASVEPIPKALRVINFSSDGHEGIHSFPAIVPTNNATQINEDVLPSLDAEEYKFISIQLVGTWVATVTFEGSNDNTTFYAIATTDPSANGTGQTTATVNRVVKVPVLTKYIRARVSAYTSGTISAVAYGHRDENSSGLISTLGTIELQAETTKKIGNVGIAADTVLSDYYVSAAGAVGVNSRMIRAQACTLKSIVMMNTVATPRYVKLYDTATTPTAGSGTPVLVLALPAAGTLAFPLGLSGFDFASGIGMTITLGPANDNVTPTATVADVVLMSVFT
jgi:hypothetical protein